MSGDRAYVRNGRVRGVPARVVLGLRSRRLYLGLSQVEVARRIGCDNRTVCAWERGARSPDAYMLDRYAEALDAHLVVYPPRSDDDIEHEIAVARAVDGSLSWRLLTESQRADVFARLRSYRWSLGRIAEHLHLSGSAVVALEAGHVPRQYAARGDVADAA